jgi:hypothetical protein
MRKKRKIILCAGMQGGGTTFISWCFLQRSDTNGFLDMATDRIETVFDLVEEPYIWVKMTTSAFRWFEVAKFYESLGYSVQPCMVVRNPYSVYSSLTNKWYGIDGTTAEDPPIKIRFIRWLEDWKLFVANQWPIIRFESLADSPSETLQSACEQMGMSWDRNMESWPKTFEDIAYTGRPNDSFRNSDQHSGLFRGFNKDIAIPKEISLFEDEVEWISKTCHGLNLKYDYTPVELHIKGKKAPVPSYGKTRRRKWLPRSGSLDYEEVKAAVKSMGQQIHHDEIKKLYIVHVNSMSKKIHQLLKNSPIDILGFIEYREELIGRRVSGVRVFSLSDALHQGCDGLIIGVWDSFEPIKTKISRSLEGYTKPVRIYHFQCDGTQHA